MKRGLCALLVLLGTSTPAWAFLEATPAWPTLGKVIGQASHIVVLRVDKVSREKQAVIFTKVADLKGKDWPEVVKHRLTDGCHPRQARTVLDWAEPGETAVCFQIGEGCLTCIGGYWYQCAKEEAPWWGMTTGRPEMAYAYRGSTARLRDHVTAILAGQEVVVTTLKYEVLALAPGSGKWTERKIEHWATFEAVSSGRLMRGKDWPLWRIKASLKMPQQTYVFVRDSLTGEARGIAGDGPAGPEDVPALVKALGDEDPHVRAEAAGDLGLIGPPAAEAGPRLLELAEKDADPRVRAAAARALAGIDPKNDKAVSLLVEALKDKAARGRQSAAESLGDLGPGARSAVAALVAAVKDPDPAVSWAAVDALGLIGPDAAEAVPALVEALKDVTTRGAAVDALGLIGPKAGAATAALEQVLKGDDASVRWPAAVALVRIGGSGVKAGLQVLLTPDSVRGRGRYEATNVLMAPAAWEALPELIRAVRDPAVRDLAADVAREASTYLRKDQIPDDVKKLAQDPDPAVRCVTAWFLYCAGRALEIKDVLAVLQETLKAPDPWARRQAARYLGALGPSARDAAPALAATLEDKDEEVRKAAAEALKTIRQP
jgi:HEAT repeat protein